jgi:SAM-dependent methyltransferase
MSDDTNELYARARDVTDPADCYFYHTTDIPGFGTVHGEWDLRPKIDAYLGGFSFRGKRVLDIGAASGFLSFHMERQGADVVSYDLSKDYDWDVVPFARLDTAANRDERRRHIDRLNNGYWLCHHAFASKAQVVHGIAYAVPEGIGAVDVAVFGSILLHLRDPFLALQNAARLTTEAVIVTEFLSARHASRRLFRSPLSPSVKFVPRWRSASPIDTWWNLPPDTVQEMLGVLGFEDSTLSFHTQLYGGKPRSLYTVVARRNQPRR